jgi:hypothetical protein
MVSVVWCANFMAPIFIHDYKPPTQLSVAFTAILGVVTASYKKENTGIKKRKKKI